MIQSSLTIERTGDAANVPVHDLTDWTCQMSDCIHIPLGRRNMFAIIDAADVHLISGFSWRANLSGGKWWYAVSGRKNNIRMHRIILNAPDGVYVDHINSDGLDNRRANLRLATNSQNQANRRRSVTNTSGYKGVVFGASSKRWEASIRHHGKRHYLGSFTDPTEAARAYDVAAKEFFGDFARLNFPEEGRDG